MTLMKVFRVVCSFPTIRHRCETWHCRCHSHSERENDMKWTRLVNIVQSIYYCLNKIFEDISPFCWASDPPILDLISWCQGRVLNYVLHCLCAMDSSDSSLVWQLLTPWQPGLRWSLFDPCTCTHTSIRGLKLCIKCVL